MSCHIGNWYGGPGMWCGCGQQECGYCGSRLNLPPTDETLESERVQAFVDDSLGMSVTLRKWTEAEMAALDRHDSLDAAWAEAEAALPEGWDIHLWGDRHGWNAEGEPPLDGPYSAQSCDDYGLRALECGPTPAAALRALAEKLRERAG